MKKQAALRLVDTRTLDRQQWLEVRRGGIGSSDAAAAVGLNPYKGPLALWMEKTGRDRAEEEDATDMEDPRYWGTLLEPYVANLIVPVGRPLEQAIEVRALDERRRSAGFKQEALDSAAHKGLANGGWRSWRRVAAAVEVEVEEPGPPQQVPNALRRRLDAKVKQAAAKQEQMPC